MERFFGDKFTLTSDSSLHIQSEAWKIQSYLLGVNIIFESYEAFVRD